MDALGYVESRHNGLAVSPQGARGSTQLMLPTAQEMAAKLNLPFRPDMLHSNDQPALNYQRALGKAYLMQGYQKYGNLQDALHYYHGGPDTRQWGPKTHAYAEAVLGRLGAN